MAFLIKPAFLPVFLLLSSAVDKQADSEAFPVLLVLATVVV
ncbi:hypothetical protein [Dickeya zeae]|nr:hypothetical protein [Dickeya zeae]AJC68427.1 hypothetical protein W909_11355 [Dickeya zeae EC1]